VNPTLDILGWQVPAYRSLTVVALAAGFVVFVVTAMRRAAAPRVSVPVAVAAVTAGLIGARLLAAVTASDPFFGDPSKVVAVRFGNMAIFGGLAGAAAGGAAAARLLRTPIGRLADAAAPAVCLGIALLRTGCLLAGCCFGKPTGMPWGITYPYGSPAHEHQMLESPLLLLSGAQPVHPIPIYEIAAMLTLGVLALWMLRRGGRDGAAFAVVVGGYALARLAIHPFRVPEPGSTPGWFDPVMFAAVAVIAAGLWAAAHLSARTTTVSPVAP